MQQQYSQQYRGDEVYEKEGHCSTVSRCFWCLFVCTIVVLGVAIGIFVYGLTEQKNCRQDYESPNGGSDEYHDCRDRAFVYILVGAGIGGLFILLGFLSCCAFMDVLCFQSCRPRPKYANQSFGQQYPRANTIQSEGVIPQPPPPRSQIYQQQGYPNEHSITVNSYANANQSSVLAPHHQHQRQASYPPPPPPAQPIDHFHPPSHQPPVNPPQLPPRPLPQQYAPFHPTSLPPDSTVKFNPPNPPPIPPSRPVSSQPVALADSHPPTIKVTEPSESLPHTGIIPIVLSPTGLATKTSPIRQSRNSLTTSVNSSHSRSSIPFPTRPLPPPSAPSSMYEPATLGDLLSASPRHLQSHSQSRSQPGPSPMSTMAAPPGGKTIQPSLPPRPTRVDIHQ